MSSNMLINHKSFFERYKSGNIVYPNAVARHFSVPLNEAYTICEYMKEQEFIKNLYIIRCPICGNIASQHRYYTIMQIDIDEEIGCCSCDSEFIPKIDEDVFALYEKI